MSCIFCNSWTHLAQNCDTFVSDESRIKNLILNNRCDCCLSLLDNKDHNRYFCCLQVKCYICFTQLHHTVFCPDRFSSKIFSIQKINKDLHFRFLPMLNDTEQLAFRFALTDATNLKPLKVITHLTINGNFILKYTNSTILVTYALTFFNENPQNDDIIAYASKHLLVNALIVNMENLRIQPQHFFRFISHRTRKLYCNNLQFTSNNAIFANVLSRLPEIEEIYFQGSNLDFGTSWPLELLQSENARKLQTLSFTVNEIGICAETLAAFMIKNNKILITLYCEDVNINLLEKRLAKHFDAHQAFIYEGSLLKIISLPVLNHQHFIKFYRPIGNLI